MSIKTKLKKLLATTACITAFLNPTVKIDTTPKNLEEVVSVEMPKAEARNYQAEARLAVLGFDIVFNGLKSGFGAYSNGDSFWEGFGKGALAGVFVYAGKEIASHTGEIPFFGAGGKLIHDFGVSMSDNVMRGEDMLSHYRTDFGFIEFDFHKDGVDLYFLPYSAGALISCIAEGDEFDFKNTLYNLTPVFSMNEERFPDYAGVTWQNIISYQKNYPFKSGVLSHEMNHVLFFSEYRFIDDILPKKSEIIEKIPVLNPFAEYFDYVKVGSWLAVGIYAIPRHINYDAYWYSPQELEAYTMERPPGGNAHPFYDERNK